MSGTPTAKLLSAEGAKAAQSGKRSEAQVERVSRPTHQWTDENAKLIRQD